MHEIIFSRCAPWNRRNACIGSPSTGACKIPIVIENLVTKEKPKASTSKPMNYRACKRMNFLRNNLISTKGTGYGNRMQSLSKDDHSIRVGHLKSPKAAQQQTSNEKWLNGVHCAYKEDRQVAESVGRAPQAGQRVWVEHRRPSVACCQAASLRTIGEFPKRSQTPLKPSLAYP